MLSNILLRNLYLSTKIIKTTQCPGCELLNGPSHSKINFNGVSGVSLWQRCYSNKEDSTQNQQETLLEKMIANLSTNIYQKNRIYKNDLLRILNKVKKNNFSSKKQGLLLLKCCTELLPDETPHSRMELLNTVWSTLREHTDFTVDHYNELLKCHIANHKKINVSMFISQMLPIKPNEATYQLLLEAVCECGDVNQAAEVISNMKSLGYAANEAIFNALIVGQGKVGNLRDINEVLSMMKSLKIDQSIETYTAIAKAFAWNGRSEEMFKQMDLARMQSWSFSEENIMDIVKCIASSGGYQDIPKVLTYLPEKTLSTPSISPYMQAVTTQLVYQNHPFVALEIYKCLPMPSFGPKDDKGLHGRTLVRDCVKASVPSSVIIEISLQLMSSGRNMIALQSACEAALQMAKVPLALELLNRMKLMSMPIRTHYFWPLIIASSKSYGERGVFNIISTMISMEITPDYETMYDYVLPNVSFMSPQNLVLKLTDCGLKFSDVLTPMLSVLLSTNQIEAACQLCNLYRVELNGDRLIKPLATYYIMQRENNKVILMLKALNMRCNKNYDVNGKFLCEFISNVNSDIKSSDLILVKDMWKNNLRISSCSCDFCINHLMSIKRSDVTDKLREALLSLIDEAIYYDCDIGTQPILHPRDMNEDQLRAHLIELESKGMNSRGVLRKLLQTHCRKGNIAAAKEIIEKCQKEQVFLSPGMRAAILDLYVKSGELSLALQCLEDLNQNAPSFLLDEHKVIDLATLMVQKNKDNLAYDLLHKQSQKRKVIGGKGIEVNCFRLLHALTTTVKVERLKDMFNLLITYGYCVPSNVILGSLVRIYLNHNDLEGAVKEFTRLAKQYNQTPLKHELLCRLLKNYTDDYEDLELKLSKCPHLNAVLEVDEQVHGSSSVHLSLLAALADIGYKATLMVLVNQSTVYFHHEAILRVCQRFADLKDVEPMLVIIKCMKRCEHINISQIYTLVMQVYYRKDDHHRALDLWKEMKANNINPTSEFKKMFVSLIKNSSSTLPEDFLESDAEQTSGQAQV